MTAVVLRGDASHLPLPDASVDLVVTSPPYFGLRSYQDGGEHYAGQIGSEATPREFLDALLTCTREWIRVLKPTGSIFVNLGDKYAQRLGAAPNRSQGFQSVRPAGRWGTPKSLLNIPGRYAIRCTDELGLIERAEIVWSKPNGMPDSCTDRVRRTHEHLFHFTPRPTYYASVDQIRTEHVRPWNTSNGGRDGWDRGDGYNTGLSSSLPHPLGALPGSVWTIPTEPFKAPTELGVDHYAAFPTDLPRRIVQGWSPREVCTGCGEGRRPAVDAVGLDMSRDECACPDTTAPTTPGVVCDPFGGTGTTALVADVLGRTGITVDMSHDYSRLAQWRTTDPGQRAKAMRVPKPPVQLDGQADLFSTPNDEDPA